MHHTKRWTIAEPHPAAADLAQRLRTSPLLAQMLHRILSGITAPIVYFLAFRKGGVNRWLLIVWNVVALGLLSNIVTRCDGRSRGVPCSCLIASGTCDRMS